MRRSVFALALFLSAFGFSQDFDFHDFDIYQETVSPTQAERILVRFLVKEAEVADYFLLDKDDNTLSIYASPQDKKDGRPEYVFKLGDKKREATPLEIGDGKKRLAKLRVAIDPGHLGGKSARLEARYIDMKNVRFDEGTLTALTARHLRKLLEAEGAEVFLTRDTPGQAVYSQSFDEWMKSDYQKAVDAKVAAITDPQKKEEEKLKWAKATPSDVFRGFYNNLDLRARVKAIQDFKPHVTVAIHYNAGGGNDTDGKNLGTNENFNMIFVAGSFGKFELLTPEARYEFMRLVVSGDLEKSIDLGELLGAHLTRNLNVPLIPTGTKTPTDYLNKYCLPTNAAGVFCRNLPLTRLPHCPTVYGETLYQDNFDECIKLAADDFEIDGYKTSSRVKAVAEAYFQALMATYAK